MTLRLARTLARVCRLAAWAGVLAVSLACGACSCAAAPDVGRAMVPTAVADRSLTSAEQEELTRLYSLFEATAIWVDAAGRPGRNAYDALAVLAAAATEGLDPADYDAARLQTMAARLRTAGAPVPREVAEFDATLSASLLRFLHHVSRGRVNPQMLGLPLDVPRDHGDLVASLHHAIERGGIAALVQDVSPSRAQYQALKAALARYRLLAADTTLAPLPSPSLPMRSGDRYMGAAALHRQLVALGDAPADSAPTTDDGVYSGVVVEGVRSFQVRHGLEADGIVGKATWSALSVPLSSRVRQIELAIERLRWLPDFRGERFVLLEIPMFRVTAWDSPATTVPTVEMRAIVGGAMRTPTPVMINAIDAVVFRPYWNIPRSILLHEILPAWAKDEGMLEREDMEMVRGQGDDARPVPVTKESLALLEAGALRMRQRPGPKNALGLLKFVLPNEEHVYLHDTPAKHLFLRSRRDFSHGCVRLQDPVALAEWAFSGDPQWTREQIVAAMNDTEHVSRRVSLKHPIRVALLYVTAQARSDGTIQFAEDIYGQDRSLEEALTHRPNR